MDHFALDDSDSSTAKFLKKRSIFGFELFSAARGHIRPCFAQITLSCVQEHSLGCQGAKSLEHGSMYVTLGSLLSEI